MKARVNFAQTAQPALEPSKFTVTVSQQANIAGCEISGGSLDFAVDTDPVLMSPDSVYSVYPPQYASGKYQNCLPHIVLHRHTLPWERRLFQNEKNIPWLVLLVFSQNENVRAKHATFELATAKTGGVFIPSFKRDYWPPSDTCSYVDIPRGLFESVLPSKVDLEYLAHARIVSLDDKVTDPAVLDGKFSCIIANRYPSAPESAEAPVRHEAHLVSLDGFSEYINLTDKSKHAIRSCETVRMFSLFSWEFLCSGEDFDFKETASKMEAGVLCSNIALHDSALDKLVALGYCPVNHVMREGSRGVAWYRPPLLPQKPWEDEISFYHYADSLLQFDSQSGLMDVTYQAAWQLGRLLAIRDRHFASKLIAWRLNNKLNAAREQSANIVANRINASERNTASADAALKEIWGEMMAEVLEQCGRCDPTGLDGTDIPQFTADCDAANGSGELTQKEILGMLRTVRKDYAE